MARPPEFSIRVLRGDTLGPGGERLGEIRVGSFTERFVVLPFIGDAAGMAADWQGTLRLLVADPPLAPAVGLPTAVNMAWIVYRFGDEVRVHQMLMMPGVGPTLTGSGRVTSIPAYAATNEDGVRISEWRTTCAAIRTFLGP